MVRDLLEDAAYELDRVSEMFAMPNAVYEDHLRKLSRETIEYRKNIVDALHFLDLIDKQIYDEQLYEDTENPMWERIIEVQNLLIGDRFDYGTISTK